MNGYYNAYVSERRKCIVEIGEDKWLSVNLSVIGRRSTKKGAQYIFNLGSPASAIVKVIWLF